MQKQKSYSDLSGDGGSAIVDQVVSIKSKISSNLERVQCLLAIGSAKGGVGKSTLSQLLGRTLAMSGYQTTLLDADFNGPTQARLSGLKNSPLIPSSEGLLVPKTSEGLGVVSMGSMLGEGESLEFNSVAKGDSFTWRATKEFSVLSDFLANTAWGDLDFLLIDLPPGAERSVQFAEYFGPSAKHILITLSSDVSRGVVSRGMSALRKSGATVLGYVENMSGYYCRVCREVKPLFPEDRTVKLDAPLLAKIPFDPELARACDQGETFEPTKPLNHLVSRIVDLAKVKKKGLH